MSHRRLLRVSETEREYNFSHTGLYRAINAGHIEAVKIGTRTFIVTESVERYLASLPRVMTKSAA